MNATVIFSIIQLSGNRVTAKTIAILWVQENSEKFYNTYFTSIDSTVNKSYSTTSDWFQLKGNLCITHMFQNSNLTLGKCYLRFFIIYSFVSDFLFPKLYLDYIEILVATGYKMSENWYFWWLLVFHYFQIEDKTSDIKWWLQVSGNLRIIWYQLHSYVSSSNYYTHLQYSC